MRKIEVYLAQFQEIKTFDPKIEIKDKIICIKPRYLNYSFVIKFISIAILIYILTQQNNRSLNLICYLLIGIFVVLAITQLKYYNTIYIDIEKEIIVIYPNIILQLFIKKKSIRFEVIKNITVVSNINSTGFWIANRRYYLTLMLKDTEELKLIGSNEHNTALKIAEKINSILR